MPRTGIRRLASRVMLDHLAISVRRQKKLIILFLLTIFLPSAALSVFSIRAIRNERYRLSQQLENEHRRAAAFITHQVDAGFGRVEHTMEKLAQDDSFRQRDYALIRGAMQTQLEPDDLVELVFLAYDDGELLFPLFRPARALRAPPEPSPLNGVQEDRLDRARRMEFVQDRFSEAATLYEQVLARSEDRQIRARMLNNMARCLAKSTDDDRAILCYVRICREYPDCTTSSRLPLDLVARIQMAKCYRNRGADTNARAAFLQAYRDLLKNRWPLEVDQFNLFASILEKELSDNLEGTEREPGVKGTLWAFLTLKELRIELSEQWRVVNAVTNSVWPELWKKGEAEYFESSLPIRFSAPVDEEDYLIICVPVPGDDQQAWLGVKIDDSQLLHREMARIWNDFPFAHESSSSVSTLSGRVLSEYGSPSSGASTVVASFEGQFPPWRINFSSPAMRRLAVMNLMKSYHLWTILTILILLTFGTALVVRTLTHEMEVLGLKSDFLASVSHEFRTPIMSIMVLVERLRQGKVKSADKVNEYYAIISQNADKLGGLVRNVLGFSKVEAGRKWYHFQETDVTKLVREEIANFQGDKASTGINIDARIAGDIPVLDIDRAAFSLAFANLLENAVKYSPVHGVILVKVRAEAASVLVDVRDEGIGIAPEEKDKIFDKFYQGMNTARGSSKGIGLGLALVKEIMEAHGGKVLVESEPGRGSTFSLVFPIQPRRR